MHFTQHSKANTFNIGTFIRLYMQMRVEKKMFLSIEFIGTSHNSVSLIFYGPLLGQFALKQTGHSYFDAGSLLPIELLNNKLHGLSPPGGLVSPSGGFASLLFDQVLHFASIILCQASWM